MSNQRSEQPCPRSLPDVPCTCGATEPVAVCPDCKSPDPKDRWCSDWNDITRAAVIRIPHVYEPELGCKRCTNPFHSRPEQGSRVPSVNAPLTAKWDKQPTAQTVAGTGNPTLDELADLRRQLAEKDTQIAALQAVVGKIREIAVKAYYGKMGEDVRIEYEEALAGLEKIDDLTAPSSLSPSTILDSIREEAVKKERERCAKIADKYAEASPSQDFQVSKMKNSRCIAAAIRSQEEP